MGNLIFRVFIILCFHCNLTPILLSLAWLEANKTPKFLHRLLNILMSLIEIFILSHHHLAFEKFFLGASNIIHSVEISKKVPWGLSVSQQQQDHRQLYRSPVVVPSIGNLLLLATSETQRRTAKMQPFVQSLQSRKKSLHRVTWRYARTGVGLVYKGNAWFQY